MLFWILVIVVFTAAGLFATVTYFGSIYNREENTVGAFATTVLVGAFIVFMTMLGASSAAKQDSKNHVVKSEKVYTIVENSVPKYDNGELEFSYVENGQVFPFKDSVDQFTVGFEKPKAFKVTEYEVTDRGVAPWDAINSGTKVEIIK